MLELTLAIIGFIITVATLVFTAQGREIVENFRYYTSRFARIVSLRLSSRSTNNSLDYCDRSTFVADTTVPDGTRVLVNSQFSKTWEIRNVGSVIWDDRYLQRQGPIEGPGRLKSTLRTRIPVTEPGQSCCVTIRLTAPSLPGSCYAEWKMVDKKGQILLPNQKPVYISVDVVESI